MSDPSQRVPPKPFNAAPRGLWRATSPAIFPPLLGVFGIGLAWRQAQSVMGAPNWIGDMVLGAATLLLIFAGLAYKAKVLRRPSALLDDLKILPGRTGLSAATACVLMLAAVLVPYWALGAKITLVLGLVGHMVIAGLCIRALVLGPKEQRRVTPAWHLSFVGAIIGCLAAVPLGWSNLAIFIYASTLPIAAAIWLLSILQFARTSVPAPLRPMLMIHLAPLGLFTIVSALLDYSSAAIGFAWLTVTAGLLCLLGARYLTAAGFSPLWGAFTFPLAAFANAMFAVTASQSVPFRILGGAELVAASLIVPWIFYKIWQLWMKGKLAKLTNASSV